MSRLLFTVTLVALNAIYPSQALCMHLNANVNELGAISNKFSVNSGFSVQNGEHKELVYSDDGETISELVWPIKKALLANIVLNYELLNSLTVSLRTAKLIQSADGTVTDTDWDPEFSTVTPIIYSSGRSELIDLTEMDLEARMTLLEAKKKHLMKLRFLQSLDNFKLNILYGVQRNAAGWRYWGGDQYYNANGVTMNPAYDEIDTLDPNSVAIRYSVKETTPYIGGQIQLESSTINITAGAKYSNESSIDDKDEHRLRDLVFYDSAKDTEKLQLEVNITAPVTESFSIWLNGKEDRLFTAKGDTLMIDEYYYPFEMYSFEAGAGMSHRKQTIMAGFEYKF